MYFNEFVGQVVAAMCAKVPLISNAIMKATDAGMCQIFYTAVTIKLSHSHLPLFFLPSYSLGFLALSCIKSATGWGYFGIVNVISVMSHGQ